MRTFTVAFISTLVLSPISVLSHYQEKDTDLDHYTSSTPTKALAVSIRVKYDGENTLKTCRVDRDEEDEEDKEDEEDEDEEWGEKKEKKKGKGKKQCHKVHRCKKKPKLCRGVGIGPNDGFYCNKKFIKISKVVSRAKIACRRLASKRDRKLPALYTASEFDTAPGPYFEWPIYSKFWNLGFRQKYRLVMTQKCEVVGAVIRKRDASYSLCKPGPK